MVGPGSASPSGMTVGDVSTIGVWVDKISCDCHPGRGTRAGIYC